MLKVWKQMNIDRKMKLLAIVLTILISASGMTAITYAAINNMPLPIRVACVGDSITQGSGYPLRLQLLLGSNYTVRNFGVSGSTVSLNSTRPYMNQTAFKKAEDFDPDIVVIMLGTNDANPDITLSEDNFEADYAQLVTSFNGLDGNQSIWAVKSPPIFSNNSSYNNTLLANLVLPKIDDVANKLNLPTVDIYNAFSNHTDYFMDGVHPNPEGSVLIANNVYDAITLPDGSPDFFDSGS